MINFKLFEPFEKALVKIEAEYPELKDIKLSICWSNGLNYEKPKVAGRFVVFEDKKDGYEIRINPLSIDMATIFIDTFPHEMAHLLHYLNDEQDFNKNPHGKKWKKYMKRIKKLLLLKEEE